MMGTSSSSTPRTPAKGDAIHIFKTPQWNRWDPNPTTPAPAWHEGVIMRQYKDGDENLDRNRGYGNSYGSTPAVDSAKKKRKIEQVKANQINRDKSATLP
jgi:hypothetical protein